MKEGRALRNAEEALSQQAFGHLALRGLSSLVTRYQLGFGRATRRFRFDARKTHRPGGDGPRASNRQRLRLISAPIFSLALAGTCGLRRFRLRRHRVTQHDGNSLLNRSAFWCRRVRCMSDADILRDMGLGAASEPVDASEAAGASPQCSFLNIQAI
jgi:hypothetical protein